MKHSSRPRGCTIWFTGLPGSGKSTLARAVYDRLVTRTSPQPCELLDSEIVRPRLSPGLGFSKPDRDRHILRLGWVASLLVKHGVAALVAAVSPYRDVRQQVRTMVEAVGRPGGFLEVHVACPLEVCIARDPKGLYARALAGRVTGITGLDAPYEAPDAPDLICETDRLDLQTCVQRIVELYEMSEKASTSSL